MNTALIKRDLLDSFKADPEYRHAWNLENVYTGVCFQIRALREQREWSQAALGKAAKMAPERISILEDPNAETKPTLSTLLRIANACDVGLDVRFVPYGAVIERSVKTDLQTLEVPSFSEELPELERSLAGGSTAPPYEANRQEAVVAPSFRELLDAPFGSSVWNLAQYMTFPGTYVDMELPEQYATATVPAYVMPRVACTPELRSAIGGRHRLPHPQMDAHCGVAPEASAEPAIDQRATKKVAQIVNIGAWLGITDTMPKGVFPNAEREQKRA